MRNVVVNTTPLIALSHIDRLDILKAMYGTVMIPKAVYKELSAKPDSICKIAVDNSLGWITIKEIRNNLAKSVYKTQLHEGEVEVMILAQETNADLVIIDDANAKKHAKYLGLPVTGTLGVLIRAKQLGYFEELKPLLYQMSENGIYISQDLIKACLDQVHESP